MDMPSLIEIKNGERVAPTFSEAEMTARLTKLRAIMAGQDIDTALLTSYHNICYYGDFLFCHFGRLYALVVTQDSVTSVSANIDSPIEPFGGCRRRKGPHQGTRRLVQYRRAAGPDDHARAGTLLRDRR